MGGAWTWLIYFVVTNMLVEVFPSPIAPPKKHVREFAQGEAEGNTKSQNSARKSVENEDDDWIATIELSPSELEADYSNLDKMNKTKKVTGKKKATSKTICEDSKAPGSKCSEGNMTLDEIIQTIQAIIGDHPQLKEQELKQLRELVKKLSQKVHELQIQTKAMSCGGGAGGNMMMNNKSIAEIEIKHSVDRKIVKSGEHIQRGHDLSVSTTPAATTINYLASPPDVNFNGGINMPMDELKRKYPFGHWPDEDYVNGNGNNLAMAQDNRMMGQGDYSQSPPNINQYSKMNMGMEHHQQQTGAEDSEGTNAYTKKRDINEGELLTPEYLELIIRNERMNPDQTQNNQQNRHHHIKGHDTEDDLVHYYYY